MAYPRTTFGSRTTSIPSHPRFPELEGEVLSYWAADRTFEASVAQRPAGRDGANEFVFYDGPPFANGLPHYGHLLTGYVKDIVPRYQTMRGRRVERRFGWDCHGLPAEFEAEKQLGINHKNEIEAMGIAQFNDACRVSVLRYTSDWEAYVTRQARWVDFANDYKTLDLSYMESVMWAFKSLWDKGLVYEGFRVLWYCWRCETPLSNTEVKMDDVYRDREDPAVTVGMTLVSDRPALNGVQALIWTTTPWTLPSNLALAVHPDVDYVVVEAKGKRYLLAEARLAAYARELGADGAEGAKGAGDPVFTVLSRHAGSSLVGTRYKPVFDFFAGKPNAHQILPADYVSTEDGTGIVHIAPAYGEDDKAVTDAAGIDPVTPVNSRGEFDSTVPPYAGQHIFIANKQIIRDLKAAGALLRHETHHHPYPHCWRCENPLIQRAVSSWFVAVTKFRDRMVELNRQITWVPEHIRDGQFGKWLENARDWSISRNRYWGSPIPVWMSDDKNYPRVDVYGSLDEIERDFGVRPTDLHRPHVDNLTRPNPNDPTGKSMMRRVPEVLDCWFESGSMSFAQVHYPFENATWFEHHYPGDFIVEYNGQTRGWFYTMHVLATALFDRPAFRTCMAHGIVLGDDGQKMSKSRKNYPDVNGVFDRDGSDAMRWFLMDSPILRGGDLVVTERGIQEGVRQALLPLWNSYYFLGLYANADQLEGQFRTDSPHLLDRYILAKTQALVTDVEGQMNRYDIVGACAAIREFLDALTNWYVRRSRDRFWAGDRDAVDTLHTVLEVTCRTAAPLLPLTTEVVWRGLTGERSVHLAEWPLVDELPSDAALVEVMDRVREICSTALGLRMANKLRVRLPLHRLKVVAPDVAALKQFVDIIRDEVNVKEVELTDDVAAHGQAEIVVNARVAGPRLGKQVQEVIRAAKAGHWTMTPEGRVHVAGVDLLSGEYEKRMVSRDAGATAELPRASGFVILDTAVTPELAAEGLARDVIRAVQQARRDAALSVSDRIRLTLGGKDDALAAAKTHQELLASETLAIEVNYGDAHGGFTCKVGEGSEVVVLVEKSSQD
ncbi:MAG TPA: isoleucine--tRNA ligase [Gemmatimonadaceae bacterium]